MTIVEITKISIGANRRPLKDEKVADLMKSIEVNGLLNPITLDQNLMLIAGLHRLTACKLLGLTQIECHIINYSDSDHARLAEIDENLIRNELESLERAELWLERDQLLEQMGLRARPGDNQYTHKSKNSGGETDSPPVRTTLELAQEAGYADRTFQQGKQIARDIAPEVKAVIRGTPAAKSPRTLLKVARAGREERKQAEEAERAAAAAKNQHLKAKAEQQARIAAEARARQAQLQLVALQNAQIDKNIKLHLQPRQRKERTPVSLAEAKESAIVIKEPSINESASVPLCLTETQAGETWLLQRHLICYSNAASKDYLDYLPSHAALAVIPCYTPSCNLNDIMNKAQVVAVVCTEGSIYEFCEFCNTHQMPFRLELLIGKLYVAVFSHQPMVKPEHPIGVEGLEGIVAYLVNLYTQPGNFVINPILGEGEVLMACERMGRTCFACDARLKCVERAITRWQKWTGKAAEKINLYE